MKLRKKEVLNDVIYQLIVYMLVFPQQNGCMITILQPEEDSIQLESVQQMSSNAGRTSVLTITQNLKKKNLYTTTYSVKTKSTGRRNVLMLPLMRPIPGITKDDGKSKPGIMKFYDFKKSRTDIVDHWSNYCSCHARTNCWDLASFSYILDTVRVTGKIVWCRKNSLDKHFQIFVESFQSTNNTFHRKSSNKWIKNSSYTQNGKKSLYEEGPPGGRRKRYPLLGQVK